MMNATTPSKAVLNKALFAVRALDSAALGIRGTIFHSFDAPGEYEVFVERKGRTVHRELVRVSTEQGGKQLDVDLGRPESEASCDCGKHREGGANLAVHGVMAFYATQGTGTYTVRIARWGDKEKTIVLDSSKELPAGDLFAATLVVPGTYRVLLGKEPFASIRVRLPDPKRPHSTERPVLLHFGAKPNKESDVEIDSGGSVVLLLARSARVRVEPIDVIDGNGRGKVRSE
jgi:hypothetical protein